MGGTSTVGGQSNDDMITDMVTDENGNLYACGRLTNVALCNFIILLLVRRYAHAHGIVMLCSHSFINFLDKFSFSVCKLIIYMPFARAAQFTS